MNKTLRWIKFEAIMTALFLVEARSVSKFNSFNHISILENL